MLCRAKVAVRSDINTNHKNRVWADCTIFRRVCKIEKSDCCLRHVRPSVHMEQLGSQGTDFHAILYLISFENLSRIFKFH
jgi:hypothetical protein